EIELRANFAKSVGQSEAGAGAFRNEEKESLQPSAASPSSQPATQPLLKSAALADKPLDQSTALDAGALPSTEPAGEQHADLVILVGAPAAGELPGTQPASQPIAPSTQPQPAPDSIPEK